MPKKMKILWKLNQVKLWSIFTS